MENTIFNKDKGLGINVTHTEAMIEINPGNSGQSLKISGGGEWEVNLIGQWEFTHVPSGKTWSLPESIKNGELPIVESK